ncbi:hypothetical protein [Allosalinactinospora lopnorensis]|uniref:hypothetical protein n=1 Tax=Allosalinactinospora lopnorensis TaxID=1352348 RepID=UPI000623E0A4|nr:hypothetical protein [Allosalinactinospora lopnorensis]
MWRAEAGAGKIEYGALVIFVAAVVVTVVAYGLPGDVRALLERGVCLIPGDQECEEVVAGSDDDSAGPGDGSEDGNGADESGEQGEENAAGGEESGEGGDAAEYDPALAQDLEEEEDAEDIDHSQPWIRATERTDSPVVDVARFESVSELETGLREEASRTENASLFHHPASETPDQLQAVVPDPDGTIVQRWTSPPNTHPADD